MQGMWKHYSACSPAETARMNTEELRRNFLVTELFVMGEIRMAYTELDRMAVGGVVPSSPVALPVYRECGTSYSLERRELGVMNLGAPGLVRVNGRAYELDRLDCLYVGAGEPDVVFESTGAEPPVFYLLSCPAHQRHATRLVKRGEAVSMELGDAEHASRRTIRKYICAECAPSAQLCMGYTELEPGSIWNTMPAHTHARRMEVYLYFGLGDGMVVHLMGEPRETRHVIAHDRQAVLSPPWSIHSGAGTRSYSFVWGMAGENQDFGDIDALKVSELA